MGVKGEKRVDCSSKFQQIVRNLSTVCKAIYCYSVVIAAVRIRDNGGLSVCIRRNCRDKKRSDHHSIALVSCCLYDFEFRLTSTPTSPSVYNVTLQEDFHNVKTSISKHRSRIRRSKLQSFNYNKRNKMICFARVGQFLFDKNFPLSFANNCSTPCQWDTRDLQRYYCDRSHDR